jgi:serine/threonine-protein kinase
MNTRDQFGNYLLLKRLGEDAIGETYRAGRVARGALERVVLLRVLNGQGFDPERIARSLQARAGLAQALKSPNVGHAIDVGQVRGVPYIAYDYASGRTLAQLLEQAARRSSPLPLDHALLVVERIGLALAVAYETRLGEDRVEHGFVTPGFVHVSNEGELKLLGFEASAGLRESAAHPIVKQAVGRYLAPETVAGQPASRADDVYSLGALLFEMATGQQVPLMPAGGLGPVLDAATLAEGGPLHPEVAALLRRTLCPREQRIGDAVAWHKAIAKVIADGGFGATTFNLAFFLHNLYRDEIEREGR